jgi:hypothetical protein
MASLLINDVACGCACDNGDIARNIAVTHRLTQSFDQDGIALRLLRGPIANTGLRAGPYAFREKPAIAR